MTFDINIDEEDKNMDSTEFDIEVIRNIIDFLQTMDCKLNNYGIGGDAGGIVCSCIEDLELLLEQ